MKKISVAAAAAFLMAFLVVSCGSGPAQQPEQPQFVDPRPEFVRVARRNAPEDVIVGIGQARMATPAQSELFAEVRARAAVARTLETMSQQMITDYQASGGDVDPRTAMAFAETINVQLSQAQLRGARVHEDGPGADGTWWAVVWMNKADVAREIDQAAAAARLAVPAMAAFSAQDRMEAAFNRTVQQEPITVFE